MKTEEFYYELPQELIAQRPLKVRHNSRLLVYDRSADLITHTTFKEISNLLHPGDLLVVNITRVIPARIFGRKATGGKAEVLLLNKKDASRWEVLVGGKRIKKGNRLRFSESLDGLIVEELIGSKRVIEFNQPVEEHLEKIGHVPLPPYIHEPLDNPERYQTIYAQISGSAAAPTAGLHFTSQIIRELKDKEIGFAKITLHVGLDTFAPVTEENIEEHHIHSEWCEISESCAETINSTIENGGRVIAVGTTTARTLETAAAGKRVKPFSGQTRLYIYPGYQFKIVEGMLTNFHLPGSTLLMMVSAFAGLENIKRCYHEAIEKRYRFYSFGDAMLIF